MNEQKQNALNEEYDAKMTRKYEGKIKDGNLEIGDMFGGDPEVTNLRFLEKFDISTLNLYISNEMSVKLRSNTLKKLAVTNLRDEYKQQQLRLNLKVNDLELENLEVLELNGICMNNDQLVNLTKFNMLHTLDVSRNKVDLQRCGLKNINQISWLINLEEIDLSSNEYIDVSPVYKIKSLVKLNMKKCGLKNIDQLSSLVNLKDLDLSQNQCIQDVSPVYKIKSLVKLNMKKSGLKDIDQIVPLTNLEVLDLQQNLLQIIDSIRFLVNLKELHICGNDRLDITPLEDSTLQYLKNLKHLNLKNCNIVSIYVLRPLVNLEVLHISDNKIVHLDANINEMTNLKEFRVNNNLVSDFSSIEQHPNYNNINENGWRSFYISDQKEPSEEELRKANKLRKIESPNIQLKEIQNQHKALKTALNNVKQEINATISNAWQSKIQFTANVVRLFQLLNQFGFE
ncbi:leucine-rich_repeat domain-containing protein [Hexamita inflata]|uniref:Leucine-rich repeat domain-containing protein n=1 Tax=Hexamita inflata TaxID=28002 RepID=A0AA86S5M0_9EUKA|nr:leucine-rich repeat domain-containing protein [Hexamita inflata]